MSFVYLVLTVYSGTPVFVKWNVSRQLIKLNTIIIPDFTRRCPEIDSISNSEKRIDMCSGYGLYIYKSQISLTRYFSVLKFEKTY